MHLSNKRLWDGEVVTLVARNTSANLMLLFLKCHNVTRSWTSADICQIEGSENEFDLAKARYRNKSRAAHK